MAEVYRDKDIETFNRWKQNKTDANLSALLKQIDPLIQSQVRNWGGVVSNQNLVLKARILAKEALETYDPSQGALSTHITTRLQKLSRDVYPYQNAARLPEHQQIKFRTYAAANANLEDRLGRKPTVDELSDELVWSKREVVNYSQQIRNDYVASEGLINDFYEDGVSGQLLMDYIYHDLNPDEKHLFELTTGYRGAKVMDNEELMKELKITQGQLSYNKRKLIDKIDAYRKRLKV